MGSSTADDGTRDPHRVRLFAEGVPTAETPAEAATRQSVGGENDSPSRQLARFVVDTAENSATGMRVRVIYRRDRYLRGSDHISFLREGWPAGRFTEPNAPGTPKGAVIVTSNLTNDTTLRWQRGDEPDLAGYEVLWRETTAAEWQRVIPVGDVTEVTIDLSKDNVFFGVRAVGRDGHRSPVAFPRPGS
ncbi:hypothetical protein [Micromonospora echinaurantiaca]|uniref:hypothetical protein n=1 Tax=Micromonospora echinaurantiaca TaxID=47857 RepID=UPI0037B33045